jgi:hypothetical protein
MLHSGCAPEDICILSPYARQVEILRSLSMSSQFSRLFLRVAMATIDNFQGEESEIVLLSLVRSNSENDIGFMREEDRICVSISRAKRGFYVFGNIPTLRAKSTLWSRIINTMEEMGCVGRDIPIRCEQHGTLAEMNADAIISEHPLVHITPNTYAESAQTPTRTETTSRTENFCTHKCPIVMMQQIPLQQLPLAQNLTSNPISVRISRP